MKSTKHEARNKRLSEVVPAKAGIQSFLVPRLRGDDRRLSIVSDFDIRISDFLKSLFRISIFEFRAFHQRGFTLVEMMVAFGIFSIIMVVAVGSFVSLMEANHKTQELKTVVNNLHFAFENISRNIRTGSLYHCDIAVSPLTAARDCSESPASSIIFTTRDGRRMVYKYTPLAGGLGVIDRAVVAAGEEGRLSDPGVYVPVTSPDIRIEQLRFYVDGTGASDMKQPRVLIVVKGSIQRKSKVPSLFNLETLVSQRVLDIES